jgi:hypothetical protein
MFAYYYAVAGHFKALVREIGVLALVLQNHPKSLRFFGHSENNLTWMMKISKQWTSTILLTKGIRQIRHNVRFKKYCTNFVREDIFDTFAQMKHSLIRRSCFKECAHGRKMSSFTHFVNNYFLLRAVKTTG